MQAIWSRYMKTFEGSIEDDALASVDSFKGACHVFRFVKVNIQYQVY